ncbi:MAG: hypothetical protein EOP83_14770 [Verrucomicrobiaceae bacterium]|nr:MAG: hypothetical protein EOP83_14770 [Verrucomicrobiaceae bacterium]
MIYRLNTYGVGGIDLNTRDAIYRIMREHFPHAVVVHKPRDRYEPIPWCVEFIGKNARTYMESGADKVVFIDTDAVFCRLDRQYGFKTPEHAFAFKMRWF